MECWSVKLVTVTGAERSVARTIRYSAYLQVVKEPFTQACAQFSNNRQLPMCELLALSSSRPARLNFSLHTLASHGTEAGTTRDGWGVAFYPGNDVALCREPAAAGNSALVRFLETSGPATDLAISHIRHATRGSLKLANTQPFTREPGGLTHVFAHNGDLPGIENNDTLRSDHARPVGQTDSEYAFCVLLALD